MKERFSLFTTIAAAVVLAVSVCVGCSDEETTTASTDCYISNVVLGSLKRTYTYTKSDGEDTTYNITVTGSYYPLYIDQLRNTIYNEDSLPLGTDISKVTFNTFSGTNTIVIYSPFIQADTTFSTSDSTDFTSSRRFRVYSSDALTSRQYTMTLNVHMEDEDDFVWKQIDSVNTSLANITEARLLALDGILYLFGKEDARTVLFAAPDTAPSGWERTDLDEDIAVRSVHLLQGVFFALNGSGEIIASTDGVAWTALESTLRPDYLVGASTQWLFAQQGDSIFHSTDGKTWVRDSLDAKGMLPEGNMASVLIPSIVDDTYEDLLLVGNKGDSTTTWKRNIDMTEQETFVWNYYPAAEENSYYAPCLSDISLVLHGTWVLLIGQTAEDSLAPIYLSEDNGRTWFADEIDAPTLTAATLPTTTAACGDDNNYIWIVCGGTGELWRGRLNGLGWEEQQYSFTRSLRNR